MDNVTHALAGLLLAEGVVRLRARGGKEPSASFARTAWVASAVVSNLPDIDLVYTEITGGRLGYLLHHRGHTHTAPVALFLGLLTAAIAILLGGRKQPLTRADAGWLVGLCFVGALGHLGMDAWNVYGVHPLWPLYDGWIYGDAVFILEPLFWVAAVPALYPSARTKAGRFVLGLILWLAIALPWFVHQMVPLPIAVALSTYALAWTVLSLGLSRGSRIAIALVSVLGIAGGFATASRVGRARIEAALAAEPGAVTHDVTMSPLPANPLCWQAIAIQSVGDAYRMRQLTIALVPRILPVAKCPPGATRASAPEAPDQGPALADARVERTFTAPRAELVALAGSHCEVDAAMRFLRAPFWKREGATLWLGDLRFDRSAAADFSDLELAEPPASCPKWLPSWTPPRADVLSDPPR